MGDTTAPPFDLEDWLFAESGLVCGCGHPELVVSLVHDALRLIDALEDPDALKHLERETGSEAAYWLLVYRLDDLDLTEHGTTAPGWLTDKGRMVLAALDADHFLDENGRGYNALKVER